jgi:hypothetical protein
MLKSPEQVIQPRECLALGHPKLMRDRETADKITLLVLAAGNTAIGFVELQLRSTVNDPVAETGTCPGGHNGVCSPTNHKRV